MAGRILLAAVLSAVLMFVWGFVFWGVLDMGSSLLQPLPAELDVLAALRRAQVPSGMYVYPLPVDPKDQQAFEAAKAKHEEGPLLQLAYQSQGGPVMPLSQLAQGLGHHFAIALLTGCLVALAVRGLPGFGSRLIFILLMSLIASLWTNVGDVVWWFHSPRYCLGLVGYEMGMGLLMGLVTAAIVRPSPEENALHP